MDVTRVIRIKPPVLWGRVCLSGQVSHQVFAIPFPQIWVATCNTKLAVGGGALETLIGTRCVCDCNKHFAIMVCTSRRLILARLASGTRSWKTSPFFAPLLGIYHVSEAREASLQRFGAELLPERFA